MLTRLVLSMFVVVAAVILAPTDPRGPPMDRLGLWGVRTPATPSRGIGTSAKELSFWDGDSGQGLFDSYGGNDIVAWSEGGAVWNTFDAELAQFPDTVLIWFQVCTGKNTGTEQVVDTIIDLIRQRTAVPIYVSALDASPSCTLGQPDVAQDLADYLVAKGSALAGPVMTPLSYPDEMRDNCHANEVGNDIWGADLAAFFDGRLSLGLALVRGVARSLDVPDTHLFVDDIVWLVDREITLGVMRTACISVQMPISVGGRWRSFIDRAFRSGGHGYRLLLR